MIIGNNNNNNFTDNFQNRINKVKENANTISNSNSYGNNRNINKYIDVNNRTEMIDKSFDMLQDRLNKGLISFDEFQKQCAKLNKLRK